MLKLKLTKTTTSKIIMNAGLFIVPNSMHYVGDQIETTTKKMIETWGCSMADPVVQLWGYCNDLEITNLMCDFYDEKTTKIPELAAFGVETMSGYRCLIPESMPANEFVGLDDGDIIYLEFEDEAGNSGAIKFTLTQKQKRYGRYGTFKTVFDMLYDRVKPVECGLYNEVEA